MISLIFLAITQHFGAPILFPVIWLDEGLELNEEMTGMIKKDLINVLLYLDIVQWTLGKII
jgi:CD36 family